MESTMVPSMCYCFHRATTRCLGVKTRWAPWMESRLKPRTAAMDRMGTWRRCCYSSFYDSIQSFYSIIRCYFYRFKL
jgi:hypothetical protein